MKFTGVSHPAMGHHRPLARPECRLASQVLHRVRILARGTPLVVHLRRPVHHQPRGLELAPAGRERVLDALVGPYRGAEDDALARVPRRAPQGGEAQADSLAGEQDALGVHAVQDGREASALGADEVAGRHAPVGEMQRVGVDGGAAHFGDLGDGHGGAVEGRVEEGEALGGPGGGEA